MGDILDEIFVEHRACTIFFTVVFVLILAASLFLYQIGPRLMAATEARRAKALAKALAKRHASLRRPPHTPGVKPPSASAPPPSAP